jgi:hypothetical protein
VQLSPSTSGHETARQVATLESGSAETESGSGGSSKLSNLVKERTRFGAQVETQCGSGLDLNLVRSLNQVEEFRS